MNFKHSYAEDFFKFFKSNTTNLKKAKKIAENGNVSLLKVENCEVIATVKSNKTFKIHLKFKPFSSSQKEVIKKFINESPEVIANLINNEIHPSLLTNLRYEKIYLIPKDASNVSMECNCSIKIAPCRHILAVLLTLANEIDNNPFLLFNLYGFDIIHEIDFFNDFDGFIRPIKSLNDLFNYNEDVEFKEDFNNLEDIKNLCNNIPRSKSSIFNLINMESDEEFANVFKVIYNLLSLASKKIFNFKFHFGNGYNNAVIFRNNNFGKIDVKKETKTQFLERIFNVKWNNPYEWKKFNIDINDDFEIKSISTNIKSPFKNYKGDLYERFLGFLIEFDNCDTTKLPYSLQFLNVIKIFTLKLIQKYLFIPDLFKTTDGFVSLRWVPNINNSVVGEIFSKLIPLVPDDLITFNNQKVNKKESINILVNLITNALLKNQFDSIKASNPDTLFVKTKLFENGHLNQKYAYLLAITIGLYHLKDRNYSFYFIVDEKDAMFSLNLKVELSGGELLSMKDIISHDMPYKYEIISDFQLISDYISNSDIAISQNYWISFESFTKAYDEIFPLFENIGVGLLLPKSLALPTKPKIKLNVKNKKTSSLTFSDISDFDWRIAVGKTDFSKEDFEKLVQESRRFIKYNNEIIVLDDLETEKFLKKYDNVDKDLNKNELLQLILLSQANDEISIDNKIASFLDNIKNFKKVEIPKSIDANLRDYQKIGFSWLVQNIHAGFGSILADDMGLGKTLEILTTISYLKENNLITDKILVIAPTSLLTNWEKEIEKFAPSLTSFIYHGQNRVFPSEEYDIILTSYGIIRQDVELLMKHKWYLIVVDEAQNIKNPSSQQTLAIKSLNSENKIAMTGTPVENNLSEYWSIFDFTNKNYLGSQRSFKRNYINPIEQSYNQRILENFKLISAPFILRRLKTDKNIIDNLPDKIVNDVYCNLTEKQAAIYQDTLNRHMDGIIGSDGISRKGSIFKLITSLKQICNHPAQFTKSDIVEVNDSGKLAVLMNILENILSSDEKVIIFTQYVQMGNILKQTIDDNFNCDCLFLHGSQSRQKRDKLVDSFQNDDDSKIFIISLKAGGTGLNLTAAQNVIHYDLWWNPAVENQATDRTYRLGQDKNVMVYRFITSGTFEENINEMIKEKEELASKTVVTNTKFITELSDDELNEIFNLKEFDS